MALSIPSSPSLQPVLTTDPSAAETAGAPPPAAAQGKNSADHSSAFDSALKSFDSRVPAAGAPKGKAPSAAPAAPTDEADDTEEAQALPPDGSGLPPESPAPAGDGHDAILRMLAALGGARRIGARSAAEDGSDAQDMVTPVNLSAPPPATPPSPVLTAAADARPDAAASEDASQQTPPSGQPLSDPAQAAAAAMAAAPAAVSAEAASPNPPLSSDAPSPAKDVTTTPAPAAHAPPVALPSAAAAAEGADPQARNVPPPATDAVATPSASPSDTPAIHDQHAVSITAEGFHALLQAADGAVPTSALPPTTQPADAAAARPSASLALATPLPSPQWGDELGHNVRWMVGNQVQSAEMRISPPQLGSIEVRISVQHDRMDVTFSAQHAQVRDALLDAAPRLRDLMAGSGFGTVNVDVSHQSPHGRPDAGPGAAPARDALAGDESDDSLQTLVQPLNSATLGLIDLYA